MSYLVGVSGDFRDEVANKWIPKLEEYKPEMIFISAGFDAHKDDFLADLNFTTEDYSWISRVIVDMADKYASGRIISTLEGGYNTEALADSVESYLSVLLGK